MCWCAICKPIRYTGSGRGNASVMWGFFIPSLSAVNNGETEKKWQKRDVMKKNGIVFVFCASVFFCFSFFSWIAFSFCLSLSSLRELFFSLLSTFRFFNYSSAVLLDLADSREKNEVKRRGEYTRSIKDAIW